VAPKRARNGTQMSLTSMTGRGTGSAASDLARIDVELSSVNRKQLDVAVGLPRVLAAYESRVQATLQKSIARGRVGGDIRVAWAPRAQAAAVRIDDALAKAHVEALRAAARTLGLPDDLKASALLALPDVVAFERDPADAEALWPLAERALEEAAADLLAMRRREGAALARDLRARLDALGALAKEIAALAPTVAVAYRENLLRRIGELLPGTALAEDERVLKEVVLFADRADVSEELVRLESHLGQALDLVGQGGVVGRALDFLVQEMGREINTVGAKANHGEITRRVVAFKAELERVREQVQNVE
jgi:uncharacterized protein (TIGR00255 family)